MAAFGKLVSGCCRALGKRGPVYCLRAAVKIPWDFAVSRFWAAYYGLFKLKRMRTLQFEFDGVRYGYFYHPYNTTYRSERAVEIPIARRFLEGGEGKSVLEIGNVLSHYFPVSHEVLDRYESVDGIVNLLEGYDPGPARIINEDIGEFNPVRTYDLIVSISTLEHVGWDETPRVPGKVAEAMRHLAALLGPGGRMLATFPVGYNEELDELVRGGKTGFSRLLFMKRVSRDNEWKQVDLAELKGVRYGRPFPAANGLAVGFAGNER